MDYVCVESAAADAATHVCTMPDVDISPMDRVDHVVVAATVPVNTRICNEVTRKSKKAKLDLKAASDPARAALFQEIMKDYIPEPQRGAA